MSPKLSIIIPVYNTEPYLRECLDSVVNQTLTDIEIIIVNDCSPDNSESIILEYKAKDPRIKYIKHEQNLGLGGARNTGIKNANGEWIAFVDSDDFIELTTYDQMISLMLTNNVNLGVFSAINFNDTTKEQFYDPYFDANISIPTKINHQNFHTIPSVTAWNKIYRLSDLLQYNIYFPNYLKHEDEEFWFKYIVTIEPMTIGCTDKFYHYRQRTDSITQNSSYKKDLGNISKNIYDFLIANNKFYNYQELFLNMLADASYLDRDILDKNAHIQLLNDIKSLLKLIQLPNEKLINYKELFYLQNITNVDSYTISFFHNIVTNIQLSNITNDKWYQFGQLSRTKKIKFIIKKLIKKILVKLHLFPMCKHLKNKLLNQ